MQRFDALKLASDLMREHGLMEKGWRITFDRARVRFGQCRYMGKVISLSLPLVELNEEKEVRDTILHEIAHALVGPGHGHDAEWCVKAVKVGATPMRCYDSKVVVKPPRRYVGACPNGHVRQRDRLPRNAVSCGTCRPKVYDPAFKITYARNPNYKTCKL